MNLADVRFVKGALFGILAHLEDDAWLAVPIGLFAIGYMVASMLTKEPPATPASGGSRE